MADDGAADPAGFVEYQLVQVADQLRRRFDAALRPHGLTARQFSVLAVLQARPGITPADLARAVLMTPQSMGALVDHLESAGLVGARRRRGRGVPSPIELSDAGSAVLDAAAETVRDLDRSTREVLGDDLVPLRTALERLSRHLDKLPHVSRPAAHHTVAGGPGRGRDRAVSDCAVSDCARAVAPRD